MIIVTSNKNEIINSYYVQNIYIDNSKKYIKYHFQNNNGGTLAQYDTEKQAQIALEMLLMALQAEDKYFIMPDMQAIAAQVETMQYSSAVKTKQNRRGGS